MEIKKYLDEVDQHPIYPMDPNNFEVLAFVDDEVPICFYAGPKDGDHVSDYYSCYGWIKKILEPLSPPLGYHLEIGGSENCHGVYSNDHHWDTDEDDPIAMEFVRKCVDELVKHGSIEKTNEYITLITY